MTRCQTSDLSWFTGCFGSNGIYFCIQNETGLIPAWQHASDFMQVFLLTCSGSVALYRGENWKSGHFIRAVVNRPAEVLMKDTKFHRCRGHFVDLLHHRLYLQHLCSLPIKWKLKTWMRRDWKQRRCSERARWLLLSWWVCPRRGIGTGLWMPLSKTSSSDLSSLQLFSKPCNFNRLANLFEWFLQKKKNQNSQLTLLKTRCSVHRGWSRKKCCKQWRNEKCGCCCNSSLLFLVFHSFAPDWLWLHQSASS